MRPAEKYGAEFYTPPPPHPWKYPSRGGGRIRSPAAWGLRIYTPHPLPLKNAFWPKMGGAGGAYIISPCWKKVFTRLLPLPEYGWRASAKKQKTAWRAPSPGKQSKKKDAAFFLLTVGSFLFTVELFYLQLTILASLLTVGAFLLTVLAFLLTVLASLLTVGKCV